MEGILQEIRMEIMKASSSPAKNSNFEDALRQKNAAAEMGKYQFLFKLAMIFGFPGSNRDSFVDKLTFSISNSSNLSIIVTKRCTFL